MTKDKGRAFTTWSILKESYQIIKPKFWEITGRFLLIAIFFIAVDIVFDKVGIMKFISSAFFSFCLVVFGFTYAEGKHKFTLDLLLKKINSRKTLVYFSAYILSTLAILGASILFVIYLVFNFDNPNVLSVVLAFPGMYVAILLFFVKYITVDREVKPRDALKESIKMTKGNRFALVEYLLVIIIVNMLGALALGVGLLFTVPLTIVGTTLIYKKLSKHHTEKVHVEEAPEVVEAEIVEPV